MRVFGAYILKTAGSLKEKKRSLKKANLLMILEMAAKGNHGQVSEHLAWELADSHINVNTVCPGGVLTEGMQEVSTPEFREGLEKRLIPLGRLCTPDEIAQAVVFLASERHDMITGQLLPVDGGLLVRYGEDLRTVLKKRMQEVKEQETAHASQYLSDKHRETRGQKVQTGVIHENGGKTNTHGTAILAMLETLAEGFKLRSLS
jgi:hypothetical protein